MSYSYDTLEEVLERAAYRLPVATLRQLISKAETVIESNEDSRELEREVQKLLGETSVFKLKKVDNERPVFRSSVSVAA